MDPSALSRLLAKSPSEREGLGFTHTLSEIDQQPGLWLEAAERAVERGSDFASIRARGPLILSGAGSSHYVGVSIAPALRRSGLQADAIPSTEILMDPESVFPRVPFTLVSFARSGDSPEGNAVVRLAERMRPGLVRQLAVTCNAEGELAAIVRGTPEGIVVLMPPASNDKSLAMTSSFSCMLVAGLFLAYPGDAEAYLALVDDLAAAARSQLPLAADLAFDLAKDRYTRVFFIASRPFVGGAHEAHLKVQELTGGAVIAKAEDTLGFRHGFMAAVDPGSLVVVYFSADPYRRTYERELLAEIRAKGIGKTIVAVSDPDPSLDALCDHRLSYGGGVSDDARAALVVLFGQLLGLYLSMSLGLKPDNPSPAGVINRVVRGVVVHEYPGDNRGKPA